ncbi:MAG TPA: TonB-dependent receptor, partial [Candidatus Angelobacter sp.]|nr:TonB-dependent receptor [Candidatus Angelobacter sp.]
RRGINVLNPALNVGDSASDARQRFVIGYVFAIPSLHKVANWAPDRIFGGWKLTGITTFQNGFPFDLTDSGFRSLTCDGFTFYACPDNGNQLVPTVTTLDPRTSSFGGKPTYWFDPCSFGTTVAVCSNSALRATLGTFGNTRRNELHGPGINNFDFSLQKDTKITERTSFQIGIEAFNLFNHTQFNNPTGRVNNVNFGRITSAASGRLVQLRAKVNF